MGLTVTETPAPESPIRAPRNSFPFLRHCEHVTEMLLKDTQLISLVESLSPLNTCPASALVGNRCPDLLCCRAWKGLAALKSLYLVAFPESYDQLRRVTQTKGSGRRSSSVFSVVIITQPA